MEGLRPFPKLLANKYKRQKAWLNTTITYAFDLTSSIYPHKLAIAEGNDRFTYNQVNDLSHRIALCLSELGITKDNCVLFQMPNWAEAVYLYLGLQRLGAVPVLCLPRYGERELDKLCTITGATAWIGPTSFGRLEVLAAIKAVQSRRLHLRHLITVRSEPLPGTVTLQELLHTEISYEQRTKSVYRFRNSPDDVIHLAPTGGTTGLPKLVPHTHNTHLCRSYYLARSLERAPDEVHMVCTPLAHAGPQQMNMAFMALFGGTMILCPSTKAEDILLHIQKYRVNFCFFVPTLLADLLEYPRIGEYDISSLKVVCAGGARTPPEMVKRIYERLACRFHNCYGMTEGVGSNTRSWDSFEVVANTVGKDSCPYNERKVVDDFGAEVPEGCEGELVVRGPCITSGYFKSDTDNEEVFTNNGFFHTGDIAIQDRNKDLRVVGRKKDIINRGGDKISAPEIEDMIQSHPKVLRVAVVGTPDPRLGERVCAYIQPKLGQDITFDELISHLKANGASVLLLPEKLEIISELPLTPANKVDKQKLREYVAGTNS